MTDLAPTPPPTTEAPAPQGALASKLYPDGMNNEVAAEPAPAPLTEDAPANPPSEPAASDPPVSEPAVDTPAEITYDLTFPENFSADDALLTELKTVAAEAKLPHESAQRLVDMHVKATEAFVAQQQEAFANLQKEWVAEIEKAPAFSTPAAREQSLRTIASVLDEFGSPEVRQAFDMTGAGNNPHVVNFLLQVAQALTEGAPTTQGKPPGPQRGASLGQRLYPSQN